ncbi:hypothetical protein BgiMline_020304, partial [Biomphalaria glabrata]
TLEKCRLWLEESDDGQTGFTELVSNCCEIAGDSVSKSRNDSVDEGVLSDKESETSLSELKTQLEAYQQDQKVEQMYSVLNCKCYTLKDNGEQEALLLDKHKSETHKELPKCTKNPEHEEFLSLPFLKLDHLPIEYRDKNMLDFVKVMGDLTVQVTLNIESFQAKGKQKLKYGTGVVTSVLKQFSTCQCKKCKMSKTPSDGFWEIDVCTIAQLVSDDCEASSTSLRLFFDKQDSPLITLDELHLVKVDVDRDCCTLACVTCDKDLGSELHSKRTTFDSLWRTVSEKHLSSATSTKFMFIVSHPHGCPKQVSFGQWVVNPNVEDDPDFQKFAYTASTCPGSLGAPVCCVGYTYWHSHSRTIKIGSCFIGVSNIA